MPDGAVIAVVGTLAGSTITGIISLYRAKIQERSQNNRKIADHYLDEKIKRLTSLYSALIEIDKEFVGFVLDSRDEKIVMDEEEFHIAKNAIQNLNTELDRCEMFLVSENRFTILHSIVAINAAFDSVQSGDEYSVNWDELDEFEERASDEIDFHHFRKHIRIPKTIIKKEVNEPIWALEGKSEELNIEMKEKMGAIFEKKSEDSKNTSKDNNMEKSEMEL